MNTMCSIPEQKMRSVDLVLTIRVNITYIYNWYVSFMTNMLTILRYFSHSHTGRFLMIAQTVIYVIIDSIVASSDLFTYMHSCWWHIGNRGIILEQ